MAAGADVGPDARESESEAPMRRLQWGETAIDAAAGETAVDGAGGETEIGWGAGETALGAAAGETELEPRRLSETQPDLRRLSETERPADSPQLLPETELEPRSGSKPLPETELDRAAVDSPELLAQPPAAAAPAVALAGASMTSPGEGEAGPPRAADHGDARGGGVASRHGATVDDDETEVRTLCAAASQSSH